MRERGDDLPSSTFFNLAPEKREKLLSAAIREFTERSYSEASINRIIRAAHIPRGSFYMYFRDKEELFRYLMRESMEQLLAVFSRLLREQNGDLFAAVPTMYDYLQAHGNSGAELDGVSMLAAVVNCNCGLQKSDLLAFIDQGALVERLENDVDVSLLDLQSGEELEYMLRMVMALSIPLIYNGLRPRGDPEGREKLETMLKILRRGMEAKPACADEQ